MSLSVQGGHQLYNIYVLFPRLKPIVATGEFVLTPFYPCPFRLSKMPIGVADRDLVQNISRRYDEATNTTYLMYHHTTHPSKPEIPGIVRSVCISV